MSSIGNIHDKRRDKAAETTAEAMRVIEAERLEREAKTKRLRQARLAQMQASGDA